MTRDERNQLVLDNLRLVYKVANKYKNRARYHELEYDDLVSIGTIGLIKAIDNYDPSYGCVLSTYAVPSIRGAIQASFRDFYRGPRFNRRIKAIRYDIMNANLEEEQYSRIAEEIGASIEEVVAAIELIRGPFSFDRDVPKSDKDDMDFYEVTSDGTDFTDDVMLDLFVDSLSERDKFIFVNTLEDKTQSEIGQALGVSQAQVNRLLKQIRTSMNEYLGRNVS